MSRISVLALSSLVGCVSGAAVDPEPSEAPVPLADAAEVPADPPPARDPARELVAAAIAQYRGWPLVDDEHHWAPGLCAAPMAGARHVSVADEGPHQQKVFTLHALDVQAYGEAVGWVRADRDRHAPGQRGPLPVSVRQVLVKDAHAPVPTDAPIDAAGIRPAMRDGKPFTAGAPLGLFVMLQSDDAAIPSDAGWIYGTATADGEITAAGVIEACAGCHGERPSRLFGLPRPPRLGR